MTNRIENLIVTNDSLSPFNRTTVTLELDSCWRVTGCILIGDKDAQVPQAIPFGALTKDRLLSLDGFGIHFGVFFGGLFYQWTRS